MAPEQAVNGAEHQAAAAAHARLRAGVGGVGAWQPPPPGLQPRVRPCARPRVQGRPVHGCGAPRGCAVAGVGPHTSAGTAVSRGGCAMRLHPNPGLHRAAPQAARALIPGAAEAEAGGLLRSRGRPELRSETLAQNSPERSVQSGGNHVCFSGSFWRGSVWTGRKERAQECVV